MSHEDIPDPIIDADTLLDAECNVDQAAEYNHDDTADGIQFLLQDLSAEERRDLHENVPYCKKWMNASKLHILRPNLVQNAYTDRKELGLFMLFLTGRFFENVRNWTSVALKQAGMRTDSLSKEELYAYIGLEIATSVNQFNELSEYWAGRRFLGNADFKRVMGRDKFTKLRANLRLYPTYDHAIATSDTLWHSRVQLEHFMRNASGIAVPVGVSSLDENTIRCKARTKARSYMKNKPIRFGIRFYTVVGWDTPYLHSFWDNGCGNCTGVSPPLAYCTMFRSMRGPYERSMTGKFVKRDSPSALWCLQVGHQSLVYPTPEQGRLIVMDNFYTRLVLGEQLKLLTDNECRLLETVRFNNIDGVNRPAVKRVMEIVKNGERGAWLLCHALTKGDNRNSNPVCGYVVFKDRSVVLFYSNDLGDTPRQDVEGPSEHTKKCVRGMAKMKR